MATLGAKTDNSSNERLFSDKKPKLITEIIQTLRGEGVAPNRVTQTLDGQSCQKGTVNPAS